MSILVPTPASAHNQPMNLKSKYFDKIRMSARPKREAEPAETVCQWEDCKAPATHKAPMGRQHEGRYLHFCFDHVREYNKAYNYFSGLDDDSVAKFQKDALTGHRPTWTMGVNRWGTSQPVNDADPVNAASARIRARLAARGRATPQPSDRTRRLRTLEKRALDDLGLPHNASAEEIRSRYKSLVKRHHPDANGGDRSTEDRLRQIIQAYKFLKQAGFC
ncbi:MAG: J domain-containing protein [Rhizobiaceae bacterium]